MAFRDKDERLDLTCLLLNTDSALLARGDLESEEGEPNIRIHITGGDINTVVDSVIVQIIPTNHQLPPRMAQLIQRRGNHLTFEPMRRTGEAVRKNFRMQVDFASFVYPKGGGRAAVRALDLSCGGIAMYSAGRFRVGEVYEVVIPITADGPLILDCEILRATPYSGQIYLYAAKFVDLIPDQEAMLTEAVFLAQLQSLQNRTIARK